MPSEIKRYALVRGLGCAAEKVAAYLPRNYKVSWSGKTDWHYTTRIPIGQTAWRQHKDIVDDAVLIEGRDDHGWTLDGYVIPRLGSGLMRCDEIELSHPVMKEVPV